LIPIRFVDLAQVRLRALKLALSAEMSRRRRSSG
jgi:hypothetical protein